LAIKKIPEDRQDICMLMPSERLMRRFRELDVAFISGAEDMTDEELNEAAAKLHEWADRRLAEGAHLYPPNVCVKCLYPHQEGEEACMPQRKHPPTS
jgi:hypothetical protein